MNRLLLAGFIAALATGTANADFTATAPGPLITAGSAGNPSNGVFTATYAGPSAIWGQLNFTGNITPFVAGTWIDDARFLITNPANGLNVSYRPSTVQTYPANTPVVVSSGVFIFGAPGNYTFEATDVFDDGPGNDAVWNSASFNFVDSTTPITPLGEFANNTPFVFDTETSNYDTELGLYNSNGSLIANDDDGGTGLQSLITSGILAPGSYYLLAGGFNSAFGNGFAAAGADAGNLAVNVNGSNVFTGAGTANAFNIYQFDVSSTPAPAALWMGLAGAGVLAGLRRRFSK